MKNSRSLSSFIPFFLLAGAAAACGSEPLEEESATGSLQSALLAPYVFSTPVGAGQWIQVHVLDGAIPQERAAWLARTADLSTVTQNPMDPGAAGLDGLVQPNDRIVITQRLLIWFSLSGPVGGTSNGGSGFIRGVWPLRNDGAGQLNFARIRNGNNWAPNEMLPGSNGAGFQGSGVSLLVGLGSVNDDRPSVNGMHAEGAGVRDMWLAGTPIRDGGWGSGSGYFFQSGGYLIHSERDLALLAAHGYDSPHDMNPQPGVQSNVRFVVTHRILPNAAEMQLGISLTPEGAPTGPIATYVISNNFPGSTGFHHRYFKSSVGQIVGNLPKPSCLAQATVPASTVVPFGNTMTLKWWGNAKLGAPGAVTVSERSDLLTGVVVTPFRLAPFLTPNHLQVIRNDYSAPGTIGNAYDLNYTDINQCGGNVVWPAGSTQWVGEKLKFY